MSSGRIRAITGALAPSAVLLAIAILGLFFDTYWQYVFAISITAAVIGSALAMLVGELVPLELGVGGVARPAGFDLIPVHGASFAWGWPSNPAVDGECAATAVPAGST